MITNLGCPHTDLKLLTVSALCAHKQLYVTAFIRAPYQYACPAAKAYQPRQRRLQMRQTLYNVVSCKSSMHESTLSSACACTIWFLFLWPKGQKHFVMHFHWFLHECCFGYYKYD